MSVSMYEASVPVFVRGLKNLAAILAKGEAFAAEKGMDASELTNAKLAEDMYPLVRQIQIASDAVKGAGGRLSGAEIPSFEDSEVTFADMQARIAKTVSFLEGLDASAFGGSADKDVTLAIKGNEMTFSGKDYLFGFAMPNFYFHATTAYDILRHKGVPLGKKDFLGSN
ncbi:MAG: DUF1993 domain-containing protein [Alphaproteobacteria bacterium]|nr:MAG: DUF1993 domain-containing protein [Alphaproteobacteria bacterium]